MQPVQAAYTIFVKGNPKTNTLGDCPFCHRVLLTLETKNVPYELQYIDFSDKPEWLVKLGGTVPVLKDGDEYLVDSGAITAMLEEKYPDISMQSAFPSSFGANLLPAFKAFLLAGGSATEVAAKRAALEHELKLINDGLVEHKDQLFPGSHITSTDAVVAPRLYHAIAVLRHFKNWQIPPELTAIKSYWAKLRSLPAWQNTDYGRDVMIESWTKVILTGGH